MTEATFSIGVATYGDQSWVDLAHERALPSAERQRVPVLYAHGATLAQARNEVLEQCETTFLVHLDADDELEHGYIRAMATGTCDLRAPRIRQVRNGRLTRAPFMPQVWGHHHGCVGECLPQGSWLVVGTAVRVDLLRSVGGWWEEPIYEDWSAFLRCYLAGGSVEAIPQAIYRAWVNQAGRNHSLPPDERNDWHYKILSAAETAIGDPRTA